MQSVAVFFPLPSPPPVPQKQLSLLALEKFYLDFLGGGGVLGESLPHAQAPTAPHFLSFLKPGSQPGSQQNLKSGPLFGNELTSPCLAPSTPNPVL